MAAPKQTSVQNGQDMTTEEQLEAITDPGQFEKLVTAVLRAADARYTKLIHTGVNAQGKPVPSPIDGVVVQGSSADVVAAAYTTTKLAKLRAKWLDPKEGDVPKAIRTLKESLGTGGEKRNTILVLVTNQRPARDLMEDVGRQCDAANVELDLWEQSRLAGFLDNTPNGHWFRQTYLGIKAVRLSHELLKDLTQASRAEYAKTFPASSKLAWRGDEAKLTDRTAIPGLTVLSGPSGYGKSALALRLMDAALGVGRPALWVNERILEEETILGRAIHRTLEELHGSSLTDSSEYLTTSLSVLVVVDDLAKTPNPKAALQKILSWGRNNGDTDTATKSVTTLHLLAPVWPDFISALREDIAKDLGPFIFELQPLQIDEAIQVYRIRTGDGKSTDDEVVRVVERLGNDPLLIDLCDQGDPNQAGADIVRSWIARQLRKISQTTGRPASLYEGVLLTIANGMLHCRSMTPFVSEIEAFLLNDNVKYEAFAAIVRQREVLRWVHDPSGERLAFRHDRIRDAILGDAIDRLIDQASSDGVLSDPYYAELLGETIVRRQFDEASLQVAVTVCPLALFSALRMAGRSNQPSNSALITTIQRLLSHGQRERLPASFYWAMTWILAGTDAPEVEEFCKLAGVHSFAIDEALVRNGRVDIAAKFILSNDLGLTYPGRDRLIVHAAQRHPHFLPTIAGNLVRKDLDLVSRRALLLLAGFARGTQLAEAVRQCIANSALQTPEEIESALWAITQCSPNNLEESLDLLFTAYTKLSDQRSDSMHVTERERALFDLGGRRIAAELPLAAVPALLQQWEKRPEIQRDLDSFFYRIDDPRTINHVIRNRANRIREDKRAGNNGGEYPFFADEWRLDIGFRRRMSLQTRDALHVIWKNINEEKEERTLAFILWNAQLSPIDLPIIRNKKQDSVLGDRLLLARVSLGDKSSYADFIRCANSTDSNKIMFWQWARGHMDEQLALGLDACLGREDLGMERDSYWVFSQLIMELDPSLAEKILEKHWGLIKDTPRFFQATLFVNTAITRALAADVFAQSTDRPKLLEHLHSHFGFNEQGRSQRITLAHVDALVPYLDYLGDQELKFLWHSCNRRQWFEWRRRNVDPRLATVSTPPREDVASREELLDQFSTNKTMIWSGAIERDFCEIGYSVDQAFSIVAAWVEKRGTEDALHVAADLFINSAYRSHLALFDTLVAEKPERQRLRESVYFAVKHRTLI